MPEIQAACQIVSREALPAQAAVRLQWVDGAPVQSVGGAYTPPVVPGGTVVVVGALAAQYEVLPQVYYPVPHSLVVRDLRGVGAAPAPAPPPPAAEVQFVGNDGSAGGVIPSLATSNARQQHAAFLAALGATPVVETFSGAAVITDWASLSILGGTGTITPKPGAFGTHATQDQPLVGGTPTGRFNTTLAGSGVQQSGTWFETNRSFIITLTAPFNSFSFFGTDWGDFDGAVEVLLLNGGAQVKSITLPTFTGTNGAYCFFGYINPTQAFDEIRFEITQFDPFDIDTYDTFGFDDISVGTAPPPAPPAPVLGPVLPVEAASVALSDGSTHHTVTLQGPAELADALRAGEQPAQVSVQINSDLWWFVVEEIDQPRAFARDSVTVRGRSVAALASAPFQAEQQWQVDAPTTAAQLATLAQTFTGLEVQWLAGDWLIPAGGFSFSGDPLALVRALAAAIGADVVADRANFGVTVRPRYATGPNLWATTPPIWQVPWAAIESAQTQRADTPEYDGLVVAGPRQGDVLQARLAGTSGATQAPMITDPALTDLDALRLRAAAALYSYGKQVRETRKLQIHLSRAIREADLVRWVEPDATWAGAVRSYAIEASLSNATQTVSVERRTSWISGTTNPAAPASTLPTDPMFGDVVLLLPMDDLAFTDRSSIARVPGESTNLLVVDSALAYSGKAAAGGPSGTLRLRYSASVDFKDQGPWTIEFRIRVISAPSDFQYFMCSADGAGGLPSGDFLLLENGNLQVQGYCATTIMSTTIGQWHHIRVVRNAENYSVLTLDGVVTSAPSSPGSSSTAPRVLDIFGPIHVDNPIRGLRNAEIEEVRVTRAARSSGAHAAQSSAWPTQ